MLRSSAQGVDPPVCRVLDVAATLARDSSCLFRRAICPLEGGGRGGQTGWHRAYNSETLARFWKQSHCELFCGEVKGPAFLQMDNTHLIGYF